MSEDDMVIALLRDLNECHHMPAKIIQYKTAAISFCHAQNQLLMN
jgi:hypothetical protein